MASISPRIGIGIFIVLLAGILSAEARLRYTAGSRSGGATVRYTTNGYYTSYDSVTAFKYGSYSSAWRTTGAGAAAYTIISGLVGPGRPIRSQYVSIVKGDVCLNFENFNSTMLGEYQCPMDGFQSSDLRCCGPDGYEYCCYDDGSINILAIIIPIIVITVLLGVGLTFGCKYRQQIRQKAAALCHRKQQPSAPSAHKLEPVNTEQ